MLASYVENNRGSLTTWQQFYWHSSYHEGGGLCFIHWNRGGSVTALTDRALEVTRGDLWGSVTKGHVTSSSLTDGLSCEPWTTIVYDFGLPQGHQAGEATWRHSGRQLQPSFSFSHPGWSQTCDSRNILKVDCPVPALPAIPLESPHSLWSHQSWGPRHQWAEISHPLCFVKIPDHEDGVTQYHFRCFMLLIVFRGSLLGR